MHIKSYLKVWFKLTAQQFQSQIGNARGAAILFILGKLFRLGTAFLMLYVIMGRAKLISGYTFEEAIFILAIFNFISSLTQLFMRGIYVFRQKVIDGTFDFYLLNPLSELFYSLFSYTDPMDALLIIPYLGLVIWAWLNSGYPITFLTVSLLMFVFTIVGVMIIAWHIAMLALGIKYLEVDNTVMLYRDLEKMAALPIEIYGKFGASVLTYVFPFALMSVIPARLVFGLYNPIFIIGFIFLALAQLKLSLFFWRRALRSYSSASS